MAPVIEVTTYKLRTTVLENRIAERRKVESPGCFLGSATYPYVSLAIMCAYISPKRCTEDVL